MPNTSETTLMGNSLRFTDTGEFIQTLRQDDGPPYYEEIVLIVSTQVET